MAVLTLNASVMPFFRTMPSVPASCFQTRFHCRISHRTMSSAETWPRHGRSCHCPTDITDPHGTVYRYTLRIKRFNLQFFWMSPFFSGNRPHSAYFSVIHDHLATVPSRRSVSHALFISSCSGYIQWRASRNGTSSLGPLKTL